MLPDRESDSESGYKSCDSAGSFSDGGSIFDWSDEEDIQQLVCKDYESDQRANSTCLIAPSKFGVLPLELVLEVCRFAHPRDVLALARSSKHLRRILTSRKSINIWKASWENTGGAPSCPDDQTYMQWTQLIFGTECTLCWNKHGVRRVHWGLRARPCKGCIKLELVSSYSNEEVPEIDQADVSDALKILPCSGELLDREVDELMSTWLRSTVLATLETLRELAGRQDSEALEQFKRERVAEAKAICASSDSAQEWFSQYRKNARRSCRKPLALKLIQAGHDKKDVLSCVTQSKRTKQISEKHWEALQPRYEAWIEIAKKYRLDCEAQNIRSQKRAIADKLWRDYKLKNKQTDPFTPEDLYGLPGFAEAIHSDVPLEVVANKLQAAMTDLPQKLQEWRRQSKMSLLKKIGEALQFDVPDSMSAEQIDSELRRGEALNVVFKCTSGMRNNVSQLSEILKHRCFSKKDWMFGCLAFDTNASRTISETVMLAGLDLESATQEAMDRANARFTCKTCPATNGSVYARTWRNCVEHGREHEDGSLLGWNRLDDQVTATVIEHENLSCRSDRMMCLICPPSKSRWNYLNKGLERHFLTRHNKTPLPGEYAGDPKVLAMLVLVPTAEEVEAYKKKIDQEILHAKANVVKIHHAPPARKAQVRHAPLAKEAQQDGFKCTHCKNLIAKKASRIFQLTGIVSHVKAAHKVEAPTRDRDYYI